MAVPHPLPGDLAELIPRRKDDTHVYYRIADEAVFTLCAQVCGSLQAELATLNALVAGTGLRDA